MCTKRYYILCDLSGTRRVYNNDCVVIRSQTLCVNTHHLKFTHKRLCVCMWHYNQCAINGLFVLGYWWHIMRTFPLGINFQLCGDW